MNFFGMSINTSLVMNYTCGAIYDVNTPEACAELCLYDTNLLPCQSFEYSPLLNVCLLRGVSATFDMVETQDEPSWNYYELGRLLSYMLLCEC